MQGKALQPGAGAVRAACSLAAAPLASQQLFSVYSTIHSMNSARQSPWSKGSQAGRACRGGNQHPACPIGGRFCHRDKECRAQSLNETGPWSVTPCSIISHCLGWGPTSRSSLQFHLLQPEGGRPEMPTDGSRTGSPASQREVGSQRRTSLGQTTVSRAQPRGDSSRWLRNDCPLDLRMKPPSWGPRLPPCGLSLQQGFIKETISQHAQGSFPSGPSCSSLLGSSRALPWRHPRKCYWDGTAWGTAHGRGEVVGF